MKKSAKKTLETNKKKWPLIGSAVGAAAVLTALTLWLTGVFSGVEKCPDPKQQTTTEVSDFLKSEKFAKMPMDSKVAYVQSIDESKRREIFRTAGTMSQEDRNKMRSVMRSVRRQIWRKQMKKYFTMTREEQNKMLDQMIERRRQWRERRNAQNNRSSSSSSNSSTRRRRPRSQAERIQRQKNFLSRSDSETRAQFTEFIRAMRERQAGKR